LSILLNLIRIMGLLIYWMLTFFKVDFWGWNALLYPNAGIRTFWAMQVLSFYHNAGTSTFSGNAGALLLPKCGGKYFFGQCRCSAFTQMRGQALFRAMQLLCFTQMQGPVLFRAMQMLCFYPNAGTSTFSGNAAALLLPKCEDKQIYGQCTRSPFTQMRGQAPFWVMETVCFYPKCGTGAINLYKKSRNPKIK
jgi:hypothetical protein